MGIGPFSTYAPPGVYTQTITEPIVGTLLTGLRVPVYIGTANESLYQSAFEMIRGSSSSADTPIFGEDTSGRWVTSGPNTRPVLGACNGNTVRFKVKNYPIVDGSGAGRATFDGGKVSVLVNGNEAAVAAVDGPNGIVTLLIPPSPNDFVTVNYYFRRKDTMVTDDVSDQVSTSSAVLPTPKVSSYNILADRNVLLVKVNDASTFSTVTLTVGSGRTPSDLVSDLNGKVSGLSAFVSQDVQGNARVTLLASGNIEIGGGSANGALGFNTGDKTNRTKTFYVFNGPIVDGRDNGDVTNVGSSVTVTVNGTVLPSAGVEVVGATRAVTLPFAPPAGSIVTIRYYFNTWQDTFDYLPNSNITQMVRVGINQSSSDYLDGRNFVVVNEGDQSKIMWGAAYTINSGVTLNGTSFGSAQITARLVDNRIFGSPTTRVGTSLTDFDLGLIPTTGNGRDTPLSTSLYNAVTNGRIDLPTNNPTLITAYVGKTWRDAYSNGRKSIRSVNGSVITMDETVSPDYKVFCTFWYSTLAKDNYTLSCVSPGATGTGQYTVSSQLYDKNLFGVRFNGKSGMSQVVQFPSGYEDQPDAVVTLDGTPVPETVTVTFNDSIEPATHASITSAGNSPFDVYAASSNFGSVIVDGNPVSVNLLSPYVAKLVGQPVVDSFSFLSTDRLRLTVDGVTQNVNVSAATDMAGVRSAINAAFGLTVASVLNYGSEKILVVTGTNAAPSEFGGTTSEVKVLTSDAGFTSASVVLGLSDGQTASGSFNSINQAARLVGTGTESFLFDGTNNGLNLEIDGNAFAVSLPNGSWTAQQVANFVNDAWFGADLASATAVASATSNLIAFTNSFVTAYNAHRLNTAISHANADTTNTVSAVAVSDLAGVISRLNALKAAFLAHRSQATVHMVDDSGNGVTTPDATDLNSALTLAHAIQVGFNGHLSALGSHGHDDLTNTVAANANAGTITSISDTAGPGSTIAVNLTGHNLVTGDSVTIAGVTGIVPSVNGTHTVTVTGPNQFTLDALTYTSGTAVVTSATIKTQYSVVSLLNSIRTQYTAHRSASGVHLVDDSINAITAPAATDLTTAVALCADAKLKYNAHIANTAFHVVADSLDAVTDAVPTATFEAVTSFVEAFATKYNSHRTQVVSPLHVHGHNATGDSFNTATTAFVARAGAGSDLGKLVLVSQTNTSASKVYVAAGSANPTVGFTTAQTASVVSPSGSSLANALNANSGFADYAVAYGVSIAGFGGSFLRVDSLSAGSTSSLRFNPGANSVLVPGTGLGITSSTHDNGESAVSGFTVSSSNPAGSSGIGELGQTYTDSRTGLRFTVLPPTTGNYTNGGKFTMVVGTTLLCDSAIPSLAVPGLELTVANTVGVEPNNTAVVATYMPQGSLGEPKNGSSYYVTYYYGKTDYSTQLYTDLKKIQATYGDSTPDNPLSMAARLAILNGAVIVGLKQVKKLPNSAVASIGSYLTAIEDLQKPLSGNIKPDVITPLTSDPAVFAALNQHCLFMSAPRQEGERTGIVGTAVGTTPTGVSAIARGLSSELMSVVYPDSLVVTVTDNAGNISTRLVDGTYAAAALAGSTCSPAVDVATPWTRRTIAGIRSVGRIMDPTEANQVAVSGVTILEQVETGVRVRHGLTTRVDNVITRTPSVQLTVQYVQQQIRAALDPFIGQKFVASIPKQVETAVMATFQNMISAAIVNTVSGISATVDANDPTVLRVEAIYVPVFPLEYIVAVLQIRVRN